MKKAILLSLLLSACASTPIPYTGKEQGNLIVYRPLRDSSAYMRISIKGAAECSLMAGEFFVTTITKPTSLRSTRWGPVGTGHADVSPGDVIKAEFLNSGMFYQKYIFTKVDKKELQGLRLGYCSKK